VNENEYMTKKEITEELLYKDKNFFSGSNLEFKIFKYTSLFAIITFIFQSIIVLVKSFHMFYVLNYLTYSQYIVSEFGIMFIIGLVELYYGLTYVIRKSSHNEKGVYLRLYKCRSCDFTSYSGFYSNLHIVSHPDHTLKYDQVLIKYQKYDFRPWFLKRPIIISRRKRLEKSYDPEFTVTSGSDRRISKELKSSKQNNGNFIGFILWIFITSAFICLLYSSPKSLIAYLIIIIVIFLFITSYITIENVSGDGDIIYVLMIDLVYQGEKGNPNIKFECYKIGTSYWDYVKKEGIMEPIEVQDGELYIVDKIVVNRFWEIIGIIP